MILPHRSSFKLTRREAGLLLIAGCTAAVAAPRQAFATGSGETTGEDAALRRSSVLRDARDVDIGGLPYRTQSANRYPAYRKPWALHRFDHADEFRFELREGDDWAGDKNAKPPRNRVEMQQRAPDLPAHGAAIWFTDTIAVETDEEPRSPWTIVNQLHSSIPGVVPLVFTQLVGSKLSIHTAFDRGERVKAPETALHYADAAFARRRYTRLVYRVVLGEGTGELTLWRDGKVVAEKAGLDIGYPNAGRCRPHLKWGQYRRADAQTYALRHANVEGATLASLEARVADPKPLRQDPIIAAP